MTDITLIYVGYINDYYIINMLHLVGLIHTKVSGFRGAELR